MIILFDVDGVLVRSRAYHLGLQKTVAYFGRRMGLIDAHTLTQSDIDIFEAQSVTVEWESSAISIAALLLARLRADPQPPANPGGDESLEGFWAALDEMATRPVAIPRPDFGALARRVGAATPPGTRPSLTALRLLKEDSAPEIWAAQAAPLLEVLLGRCYDIDRSPTMQVVQNFAVGDAGYARSYDLPPHFPHIALLETEDTPALRPEMRERLLAERAAGRTWFALYTARPSLPPAEAVRALRAPSELRGFTAEAEAAARLVGLNGNVPVMAVGRLEWVARRYGKTAEDLVKPSPVHAMAAFAAARTGSETEALKAALAVERGDHLRYPLTACAGETVHVFEDSASSLHAAGRAGELLNVQGLGLTVIRHGIAAAGSAKHTALSQVADHVHADINDGLAAIL